jgi:hypothetical protein
MAWPISPTDSITWPPAEFSNPEQIMHSVHGETSLHLATPELDLDLTVRAGHLAPVVFHLPGRDVSPYALAPWEPAEFPDQPPLLSVLRGDFMCLPFGGQAGGSPHGDPANATWSPQAADDRSLRLTMEASDTGAHIEKILSTRPGQHAVFFEHQISNLDGDFNYGTHPILDLSGLPDGVGRITTSPFHWGSVFPGPFSNTAAGETQALAEGSTFADLREVQLAAGGTTDLSRYPACLGNDDLVMMSCVPATPGQPFAWSAVVLDGYLWFALKNPADFPSTLLWISNGGRTAAPWNGRHPGRIGIEEVCSHFCNGLETSRKNLLAAEGIPTTRHFNANETVILRMIHGVAAVPNHFGAVSGITPNGGNAITITGESGAETTVPLDWKHVT